MFFIRRFRKEIGRDLSYKIWLPSSSAKTHIRIIGDTLIASHLRMFQFRQFLTLESSQICNTKLVVLFCINAKKNSGSEGENWGAAHVTASMIDLHILTGIKKINVSVAILHKNVLQNNVNYKEYWQIIYTMTNASVDSQWS